jgi:XrtN system VIT domain protein
LWVNDVEEKSILTTKEKADSAYKTIVGVEKRDPSVVHWREGNKVSLRVFPVFAGESRKFKIGVTAPLTRAGDKLLYQDIRFDGPDKSGANESIDVQFNEEIKEDFPASFTSKSTQSYKKSGKYEPGWSLRFQAVKPSPCTYSFNGNTYSISPYHKKLAAANITSIYLDVNSSWSKEEWNDVIAAAGERSIYVNDHGITEVTNSNKRELFERLRDVQFSIFPFFSISQPSSALVVTKSTSISCSLDDIRHTKFMGDLKGFLAKGAKVRVFNIGGELSPYLKSLKEFRSFQYDQGDVEILQSLLKEGFYAVDTENTNNVVIHQSDIVVSKTAGEQTSTGPDHVMRLFVYNHILQQLGAGLVLDRPIEDHLVAIAREAYVVTPVSSMIVLETQEDYDRFNIKDEGASLKNAGYFSKGAVPEPHEWALIILGAGLLSLLYIRKRKMQLAARS